MKCSISSLGLTMPWSTRPTSRALTTAGVDYRAYIAPGVMAQAAMFIAIFFGLAVIWERDLGIVHKLLVSPAQRAALVYGKATSAGFRGAVQTTIIYVVAFLMHIQIRRTPLSIAGVFLGAMLGSAIFATLSFIVACVVKSKVVCVMPFGLVEKPITLCRVPVSRTVSPLQSFVTGTLLNCTS